MRIFLTGFPGCGKTYLGKLWAEDNGLQFYDLDALTAEEERMSIEKIFSTYGEGYFREKEAAVLRNTDRFENCIIACGGGTSCFFDNAEWMNRNGLTIFLNETKENIIHHLMNDKTARPLIDAAENTPSYLEKMFPARMPFYERAAVTVNADKLNRNSFGEIIKQFNNA